MFVIGLVAEYIHKKVLNHLVFLFIAIIISSLLNFYISGKRNYYTEMYFDETSKNFYIYYKNTGIHPNIDNNKQL